MRLCVSHRRLFTELASQLANENKREQALQILEKVDNGISNELLPQDDIYDVETANMYLVLGQTEKGGRMLMDIAHNYMQQLYWYLSMDNRHLRQSKADFTEITDRYLKSFIFPILRFCLEDEAYNSIYSEYRSLCSEFDSRIR